jgi:Ca2+-binding EF-hand superfamily protein
VYTKEQLDYAIKEVDDNGDGEIDFEEFLIMMRTV